MLQLTELVTPWSFCLAIHHISSHRCCGRPIALTWIPWTMRCGTCSSNASTVAGFATSTTWNSVSSRSGVVRPEHHWPSNSTVACSTTRMCPCKRWPLWAQTVTDVFVYELLRRLFHSGNFGFCVQFLKQLLLRNCAVDFVEICNVYVRKMVIKAGKRIFNSDKICRSYSDLNFGVTFLEHGVVLINRLHF